MKIKIIMASFCIYCGSRLDAETGLCPNCAPKETDQTSVGESTECCAEEVEQVVDEASQTEETAPSETVAFEAPAVSIDSPVKEAKKPETKNRKRKLFSVSKGTTSSRILTVVLSVLLFLTATVTLVTASVKGVIDDDKLVTVYHKIGDNYAEDIVNRIEDSDLNKFFDFIYTSFETELDRDDLVEFINESTVDELVAEKIGDFSENLSKRNAKIELNRRDISLLLKDNATLLKKEFGLNLNSEDRETVAAWIFDISDSVVLLEAKEIKEQSPILSLLAKAEVNGVIPILFGILSVVIAFFLFMNNLFEGMLGFGISAISVGGVTVIATVFSVLATTLFNPSMEAGIVFSVMSVAFLSSLLFGILLLAIGILLLVFRPKLQKKFAK